MSQTKTGDPLHGTGIVEDEGRSISSSSNKNIFDLVPTFAPTLSGEKGDGSSAIPQPSSPSTPGFFDPTNQGWGAQVPQYNGSPPSPSPPEQNMVVVAILIALIVMLSMVLASVTVPPLLHMIRRKIPVPQARIDRRYATIDGWLIIKVRKGRLTME